MRRAALFAALALAACSTPAPLKHESNPNALPTAVRAAALGQDPPPPAAGAEAPVPAAPPVERPTVRLPATTDFTLANGVRVFLVPNPEVPLVSYQVRMLGGSVEDPPGKEGLTALLATLLGKGAGGRDAAAFQEQIDFMGGTFGTSASRRWVSIEAEFLSSDRDLGLSLLADAVQLPALTSADFERERGLAIDAVKAARQEPSALVDTYYRGWSFSTDPLGRAVSGHEQSLTAITNEDVRSRAAATVAPSRMLLAVAGDFDPAAMRAAVETAFGPGWRDRAAVAAPVTAPPAAGGGRILLVDKPDALQTYFQFGNLGVDWSHPRATARHLANTILGGRFTSRLNTALRIEAGLTYGARSSFDDDLFGLFRVSTYTATKTSAECINGALAVYERFLKDGIAQEELDSARSYIQGQYAPETVETASQVATMVLSLALHDLPRDKVDGFFQRLDSLTLDEVNATIRAVFPAKEELRWVLIGRAAVVEPVVAPLGEITKISIQGPGFAPR